MRLLGVECRSALASMESAQCRWRKREKEIVAEIMKIKNANEPCHRSRGALYNWKLLWKHNIKELLYVSWQRFPLTPNKKHVCVSFFPLVKVGVRIFNLQKNIKGSTLHSLSRSLPAGWINAKSLRRFFLFVGRLQLRHFWPRGSLMTLFSRESIIFYCSNV